MAAELWFGNSGQVNKYILYTAEEIFDDSKVEDRYIRPRMEINYSKYRSGTQVQIDEMLHIDDFVIVNKENVLLQPAYSTYQLIDLRTSNN